MKIIGKVKYPTKEVREDDNGYKIGFLMDHKTLNVTDKEKYKEAWFNLTMGKTPENKSSLELIRKTLKGAEVEFENRLGTCIDFKVLKVTENKPSFKDQLDKVNYKTLMAEAHKIGLISTKVELCPELTDFAKKTATFKATIVIKQDGPEQTFEDFGEACGLSKQDGGNIDQESIKCAWIRMASTRALVRALRQATNNMEVAEEELPTSKTD